MIFLRKTNLIWLTLNLKPAASSYSWGKKQFFPAYFSQDFFYHTVPLQVPSACPDLPNHRPSQVQLPPLETTSSNQANVTISTCAYSCVVTSTNIIKVSSHHHVPRSWLTGFKYLVSKFRSF